MAYGTPADPVGGTVITVAYAVSNILDPLRWLRLLTGNADPPGSSYIVASTSTTGTQWQKVTSDLIGDGQVTPTKLQANFNFLSSPTVLGNAIWNDSNLPLTSIVRNNIDNNFDHLPTFLGNPFAYVDGSGRVADSQLLDGINSTQFARVDASSNFTTQPSFLGNLLLYAGGILSGTSVTVSGQASAGSFTGGTKSAGTVSVKGAAVGTDGISNDGPYDGGTTSIGTLQAKGVAVGSDGIASAGPIAIGGSAVYYPGNPPPLGSGAAVPSGLIAAFETAAAIAVAWVRYTAANGRILIGAGTTFSVTWVEATSYGSSWVHKHTSNSYSVSVTGSATGGPSDNTSGPAGINGLATAGGVNLPTTTHVHSLNGVSLAVSASGTATGDTSDASWVIPTRAVVHAQKT